MNIQKSFAYDTLPNGLRVIIVPRKESKTTAVQAFVGFGSFYEEENNMGMAHLIEHLVFEGTQAFVQPDQIIGEIEDIGGDIEAETNEEYTLFELAVESSKFPVAAKVLGEILQRPLLRPKDLANEKKVIAAEIEGYLDDNQQCLTEETLKAVYGNSKVARNITGTLESVDAIKLEDVRKCFSRYYVASNIVLAVSGRVDINEALDEIARNFSFMPQGQRPQNFSLPKTKQSGAKLHYIRKPLKQSNVSLMFDSVELSHPLSEAAEMLANLLGGLENSRLFKRVRTQRGLAYNVSATQRSFTGFGYFCAEAGVSPRNVAETLDILVTECSRIAKLGVNPSELAKIRNFISGKLAMLTDHHLVEAQFYGRDELLENKFESIEDRFARILRLTIEDMNSAASLILQPENLQAIVIGPEQNISLLQDIIDNY
ncbi:MAG: pitrilysin family protein [Candidatus Paceibacterota bacterium]